MAKGGLITIVSSNIKTQLVARERFTWPWAVFIGLIFLLLLFIAALLDGAWPNQQSDVSWRGILLPSLIITYILLIYPAMTKSENNMIKAFRPLVLSSDEEFEQLVHSASNLSRKGEKTAFIVGVIFGLILIRPWQMIGEFSWLPLYVTVTSCIMLGLLSWVIYTSVAGTNVMAVLHRQPLQFDIFDTSPFEPIGQHSLKTVLAFIGGCAISMFFMAAPQYILSPSSLLINGIIVLTAVLFFFLNMRHTHRVLATAKKKELDEVLEQITLSYHKLRMATAASKDNRANLAEVRAWIACEQRLKETKTWPYNTGMMRTLFFSILIPSAVSLGRVLAQIWFV